jgi:hypothetical protein
MDIIKLTGRFLIIVILLVCILGLAARFIWPDILDNPNLSNVRIGVAIWGIATLTAALDSWLSIKKRER